MIRRARLSGEGGFGIPELLIAMLILSIGIMAIVAGFSSGIIALDRASRNSTAGTLADKQMEAYRALPFKQIALAQSLIVTDGVYDIDPAYVAGGLLTDTLLAPNPGAYDGMYCNATPVPCQPVQTVTGPDGRSYRVDSYIVWYCPLGTLTSSGTVGTKTLTPSDPGCVDTGALVARPVKLITVVVRDGTTPANTYLRQTSTFDEAT